MIIYYYYYYLFLTYYNIIISKQIPFKFLVDNEFNFKEFEYEVKKKINNINIF